MPVTVLKGDVFTSSEPCDWLRAGGTLFGVEVPEAHDAVGVFILGGELLSGQRSLAASAEEALFVPGFIPVGDASFSQGLFAVGAAGSKLALITSDAIVVVIVWDE